MTHTKYVINVAFEGSHDFTVTVDCNGHESPDVQTAKFVLRSLKESFNDDRYKATLAVVTETKTEKGIA